MAKTKHFGPLAAAAGALVAVALLVLMLVLVEPRPAGATFPGENGKIAYSSYDILSESTQIYTIDPTGGKPFQVTDDCTTAFRPDYSPDGHKIAYSGFVNRCILPIQRSDYEIYTTAADGSEGRGTQAHPDNSTQDLTPSYDPTGTWIAYSAVTGTDADILAMSERGGFVFGLATNPAHDEYDPDWSPTGKAIAYERFDGNDYEIYIGRVDGTWAYPVTKNDVDDVDPSFHPNGQRIAFSRQTIREGAGDPPRPSDFLDTEIFTAPTSPNTNGVQEFQVTDNEFRDDFRPDYSPDGHKIAFEGLDADGKDYEIYTTNVDGTELFKVTDNEARDGDPSWGPKEQ